MARPSPTALADALEAFRPVLLGLVPAALSHAMGSETQRSFAIAIIAGLLAGTPAVLVLLPTAYGAGRVGAPRPEAP